MLQPQHDGPIAAWPTRPVVLHPGTLHERLPCGGQVRQAPMSEDVKTQEDDHERGL